MTLLSFLRLAAANSKKNVHQCRTLSTESNSPNKSSLSSKLGIFIGLASLPVASFFIYDRFAPLPDELTKMNFPFLARFYIRRALCPVNSMEETARCLDLAMQKVLASGLGSASPESTALVLYLARLYLQGENTNIPDLEAAFYALTFKPHVGEAVREELARLELSFKVADRLCSFYSSKNHCNPEKVHFYAEKSLEFMENGPAYLKSKFVNHPLKETFNKYSLFK